MKAHIQYRVKNVYGVEKKYPANNDAELVCTLIGQKTLTDVDFMRLAKDNEITFERII